MIIKGADILGAKVISEKDGKEIEDVDDIIYDQQKQKVIALVLKNGNVFSGMVVMLKDVTQIKEHTVYIPSEDVLKRAEEAIKPSSTIPGEEPYLAKTKVITKDGKELGTIVDVYFDSTTGDVKEFAVEQIAQDNTRSESQIEVGDIEKVGNDAVIAKENAGGQKKKKTSFFSTIMKFILGK